jgi:hypothetical protein
MKPSLVLQLASDWLCHPCLLLLRHPVLVVAIALIAAVLITGAGRSFGIPLLFWHEKSTIQRAAGFATTVLVGYIVFSVALCEACSKSETTSLVAFVTVLWALVVAWGAGVRVSSARAAARGGRHSMRWPLLPPLQCVTDHSELGESVSLEVSPWSFVQGAGLASCLLVALWWLDARFGVSLDQAVGRPMATLFPRVNADARLHVLALTLLLLQCLSFWVLPRVATPAIGLSVLVSLLAAADCAMTFWFRSSGLASMALLGLLLWAGYEKYAIRMPEFDGQYPLTVKPASAPPLAPPPLADALMGPTALTRGWPGNAPDAMRPLILVCTSGGGIRAAFWTTLILERLQEQIASFATRTLMITGASGGMVGAASWVAALERAARAPRAPLPMPADAVSTDALTELARALVFRDIPASLRNAPNFGDRGRALQGAWVNALKHDLGVDLGIRLSALAEGERRGELPSLVFSPTVVEDGTRLLISNLDLAPLTRAEAPWIATVPGGQPGRTASSTSARHVRQWLGDDARKITLATAARLSASFPFVSPAVVLPTEPRRRLVDAGYYDNFGVDLATLWLREALRNQKRWLYEHVSRIVVIQIRDSHRYVDESQQNGKSQAPDERIGSRLLRGTEGLTSPLECFVNAREAIMGFRNDAQLDTVSQMYTAAFGEEFLSTTVFELKSHVSLSWYLTAVERKQIVRQSLSKKIGTKIQDVRRWMDRAS